MGDENQTVKLARLEERVVSMDKSLLAIKDGFDKIDDRFDKVDQKLGQLWDTKNKQDGAFSIGKIIAGSIGGFTVAIMDFLFYNSGHIK